MHLFEKCFFYFMSFIFSAFSCLLLLTAFGFSSSLTESVVEIMVSIACAIAWFLFSVLARKA